MKKILGIIALFSVVLGSSCFALDLTYGGQTRPYTGPDVTLMLNEEKFVPTAEQMPPIILENRTLVPVREVFEKLGGTVEWIAENKLVIVRFGEKTIELTVDQKEAVVNGQVVTLDVPAKIINNKTLVPVRFISEKAGLDVQWDGETHTVTVQKKETNQEDPTIVSEEMKTLLDNLLAKGNLTYSMPMTIKITKETSATYVGLTEEQFTENIVDSVAHEPGIMPSTSSLCLLKIKEGADVKTIKQTVLDNCDHVMWICTRADKCLVMESGNYIMLIMGSDEQCKTMQEAFTKHFGKDKVGTAITKSGI